jgi:Calcineurin-like phosphoesterase
LSHSFVGVFLSLFIIFSFFSSIIIFLPLVERHKAYSYYSKAVNNLQTNSTNTDHSSNFNFIAVGDWGCTEDTEATVNNIISQDPKLIIGLGDYVYDRDTVDCWLEIVDPIDEKMKIAIGNHEDSGERLTKLKEHFDLEREYYSFDYENVHFIVLATELGYLDMEQAEQKNS